MKASKTEVLVSRWGNSLALRLPAEHARAMRISEGDKVVLEALPDGRLVVSARRGPPPASAFEALRRLRKGQKTTQPVVEAMRRRARY